MRASEFEPFSKGIVCVGIMVRDDDDSNDYVHTMSPTHEWFKLSSPRTIKIPNIHVTVQWYGGYRDADFYDIVWNAQDNRELTLKTSVNWLDPRQDAQVWDVEGEIWGGSLKYDPTVETISFTVEVIQTE